MIDRKWNDKKATFSQIGLFSLSSKYQSEIIIESNRSAISKESVHHSIIVTMTFLLMVGIPTTLNVVIIAGWGGTLVLHPKESIIVKHYRI